MRLHPLGQLRTQSDADGVEIDQLLQARNIVRLCRRANAHEGHSGSRKEAYDSQTHSRQQQISKQTLHAMRTRESREVSRPQTKSPRGLAP